MERIGAYRGGESDKIFSLTTDGALDGALAFLFLFSFMFLIFPSVSFFFFLGSICFFFMLFVCVVFLCVYMLLILQNALTTPAYKYIEWLIAYVKALSI